MEREVINFGVYRREISHRSDVSHDGGGVSWHLSDPQDKVIASVSRLVELADAVGGLVKLSRDVLDLGRRVLLVGRIPALGLSRLVGLVRVMRMLLM